MCLTTLDKTLTAFSVTCSLIYESETFTSDRCVHKTVDDIPMASKASVQFCEAHSLSRTSSLDVSCLQLLERPVNQK